MHKVQMNTWIIENNQDMALKMGSQFDDLNILKHVIKWMKHQTFFLKDVWFT